MAVHPHWGFARRGWLHFRLLLALTTARHLGRSDDQEDLRGRKRREVSGSQDGALEDALADQGEEGEDKGDE